MYAVGLTDQDWFEFLRDNQAGEEVNFWTPTPWSIRRLRSGDTWHFLLKSPIRKLGGFGVFTEYLEMSIDVAWQRYGIANGVSSHADLLERCQRYSSRNSINPVSGPHTSIGCIILSNVEYFEEDEYVDLAVAGIIVPNAVVKCKYFQGFPEYPSFAAALPTTQPNEFVPIAQDPKEYSRQRRKNRIGQQKFRRELMRVYDHKCAVTGESIGRVLEATHIEPYINEASNHIQNGILLRVDIHRLMEDGLISLSDDMELLISSKLVGTSYDQFDGQILRLPLVNSERPSLAAVRLHRNDRFQS